MAGRSVARATARLSQLAIVLMLAGSPLAWSGASSATSGRATDPNQLIAFDAELVMPHFADVAATARAISDPASPDYRHYLSAAAFGARFGLPSATVSSVARWFTSRGFELVGQPANRSYLTLRGSAARLSSTFGIELVDRTDPTGVTWHAPLGRPIVPLEVRHYVTAISGLDTSPARRPKPRFGPANGLHPADLARAYGLTTLRAQGLDGSGQSIAVVSFDAFDPLDIAAFDRATGISGPAVKAIRLAGARSRPGDGQVEVSLDLETVRAIAPKAQIYDYEAPQSANWSDIVNRIVEDGKARIVSISWGRCEPVVGPRVGDPDDVAQASAELAGLSIFVSSGDQGAYDCLDEGDGLQRDFSVAADYPAVSPHVISVGGTYLSLHKDGSYLGEVAWQDPLGQSGSGGGLSTTFPRPAWQAGPGVANAKSSGKRQVPDVAGPGDPASGMFIVSGGQAEVVGGTSAATPFWAGSMVLAAQLAAKDGINGLGFLDPVLYALAAAHQADGTLFHDVTIGSNLLDPATPGWDYASGWGSPRLDALVPAIVAYVRDHPH